MRAVIPSSLATDNRTAFANLRVGVLNGIAHLAGVVNSIETRILAAELAEDVPGIRCMECLETCTRDGSMELKVIKP
ncbi:BON domain-containing protein [Chloroflexi bacterium CFX2]|nr:BON domain-containing protein [Chloroflexi bacterium CFX2]